MLTAVASSVLAQGRQAAVGVGPFPAENRYMGRFYVIE